MSFEVPQNWYYLRGSQPGAVASGPYTNGCMRHLLTRETVATPRNGTSSSTAHELTTQTLVLEATSMPAFAPIAQCFPNPAEAFLVPPFV